MVPFSADALLAMLLAFYPVVGPAALARARQDRPDYFASGTLIGRYGDALKLPDGRIFDLIFDVLGPGMKWQVLEDTGDGAGSELDDPFALEEGPIVPIDESAWPEPAPVPVFGPLVADRLRELGASDEIIGHAYTIASEGAAATRIENGFSGTIGGAEGLIGPNHAALDTMSPADELVLLGGHVGQIDNNELLFTGAPPGPVGYGSGGLPLPRAKIDEGEVIDTTGGPVVTGPGPEDGETDSTVVNTNKRDTPQ
jgi:hypothetical protein